MEKIKQRITWALEIINPSNSQATTEEKAKAFRIIKSALQLIYD